MDEVAKMHKPFRSDFEERNPKAMTPTPSQQNQIDLIQTHQYFSQHRKDHPGSEDICKVIEQKMLEIVNSVVIITKGPVQ